MTGRWQDESWARSMWWSGKATRRKFLALSSTAASALGTAMLVPAPWREAFGQARPYKIGTPQPLSGTAAAGGKTALVGVQMAVERAKAPGGDPKRTRLKSSHKPNTHVVFSFEKTN